MIDGCARVAGKVGRLTLTIVRDDDRRARLRRFGKLMAAGGFGLAVLVLGALRIWLRADSRGRGVNWEVVGAVAVVAVVKLWIAAVVLERKRLRQIGVRHSDLVFRAPARDPKSRWGGIDAGVWYCSGDARGLSLDHVKGGRVEERIAIDPADSLLFTCTTSGRPTSIKYETSERTLQFGTPARLGPRFERLLRSVGWPHSVPAESRDR